MCIRLQPIAPECPAHEQQYPADAAVADQNIGAASENGERDLMPVSDVQYPFQHVNVVHMHQRIHRPANTQRGVGGQGFSENLARRDVTQNPR